MQFLRAAAIVILGTAEEQPAPAPPQPEPAALQAHVQQQGGQQAGSLLTSKTESHDDAADLDGEGQQPASCAEVAVAASSSSPNSATAASYMKDTAAGGPEASMLPPSAYARTARRPAQLAEVAQQQLAIPHTVRGPGRMHLTHGPRAEGLPAEKAARVIALECLILLFVVRCTPHTARQQLSCCNVLQAASDLRACTTDGSTHD